MCRPIIVSVVLSSSLFSLLSANCHGAVANVTGVDVTTIVEAISEEVNVTRYELESVTIGGYQVSRADLRPGTTTAMPGGNDDSGTFFGTWSDQENTPAPLSNLDINDILARNQNPNPMTVTAFGGVDLWVDTNGDNPDFVLFEAVAGAFGDTDPTVQAILPGGTLGQTLSLGSSGDWGSTGFSRDRGPNNGQPLTGISFAITDLLDDSGTNLTNTSMIEGIQVNSMGLDPSVLAAVIVGAPADPPANFDGNTAVNSDDLAIWGRRYGAAATALTGDANGDGIATGADFLIWQREFGPIDNNVIAIAGHGVPEPTTLGLLVTSVGLFFLRKSRL